MAQWDSALNVNGNSLIKKENKNKPFSIWYKIYVSLKLLYFIFNSALLASFYLLKTLLLKLNFALLDRWFTKINNSKFYWSFLFLTRLA